MNTNKQISQDEALIYAGLVLKVLDNNVEKVQIVGQIRRGLKKVERVDIVAIPKFVLGTGDLFEDEYLNESRLIVKDSYGKRVLINGEYHQRIEFESSCGSFMVNIFYTTQIDYGRMVFLKTGNAPFILKCGISKWKKIGYCTTANGLRLKKECVKESNGKYRINPKFKDSITYPPEFNTEEDFFNFLGMPYYDPDKRDWK